MKAMVPEPMFRRDLYRGTAPFYDRYRPPYHAELFEDLARRLPISGEGRLLDLACGTGQIALALADRFTEVVAVDQEAEMVAYGRARAEVGGRRLPRRRIPRSSPPSGVGNVRWVAEAAETVVVDGPFELVAIGSAFHRLRREAVADRAFRWLRPGGGIALIWADILARGDSAWQRAMGVLFEEWTAKLNATDRIPSSWEAAIDREPHEQVLVKAGFEYVGRYEFVAEQTWTVETLTGLVYSTSFLNREVLGAQAQAFEADLSALLRSFEPTGVFSVSARHAYQLAVKPA
jgi:SAM-dependent methyltransferase